MKKKICYTLFLTVCLLLALQVSAFAGEVVEIPVLPEVKLTPAVLHTEGELAFSLFSGEELEWDENSECYGDQLRKEVLGGDGEMHTLYLKMEEAFAQGEVKLDANSGLWTTPVLVEQRWSVEQFLLAYGTDSDEYAEQIMPAWNARLLETVNNWLADYDSVLWDVADAFTADHPEYFWIRTDGGRQGALAFSEDTFEYEEVIDGVRYIYQYPAYCTAYAFYGFSTQAGCTQESVVNDLKVQIDKQVEKLMEDTAGMSAIQKIAYWDNWLANQNAYNHEALKEENGITVSCHPWSAVSGLLEGFDPVCEGYAKALQLLCNKAGIPCVQVIGNACSNLDKVDKGEEEPNWEPHMWTAIKLEGSWYYSDPTWNDPTYEEGEPDRDFSTRNHLLTVQPRSHWTQPETLGTPVLSSAPYFVDIGTGSMFVVLYDENGKMLGMGFCSYVSWGEEYLYYAPQNLSEELFAQATRIVRINVGDKTAWSPLTALKAIKEAPEAE